MRMERWEGGYPSPGGGGGQLLNAEERGAKYLKKNQNDSEAMRARGIIVLVKSNYLVKNIENKKF